MTEAAEVQVTLTLDDAASKVADTIKGKFDSLGKTAAKIKSEFLSVAKGALSTALGVNLAPGLQSIVSSFQAMVDNAVNVQGRMRAVASYFVAGSDMAWSSAMNMSEKIDAQLYKSSIAIGQNIDDARAAFQYLAKASDGTTESLTAAANQTEKLLMFADVTGESVQGIASEWSMMEKGVLRTRGNLFKMLFHTGIFGKNMREASTYWGKLTDDQRNAKMAEAMGTITDRFASAPQTMGSVLAGLKNIKQRLMEVVGMNIIGVLTSRFDNVLKALERKRPQLESLAARFGVVLAKHIQGALDWAGNKLSWLEKNWDSVVSSVEKSAEKIMKTVEFIIDNKELIAAAYGVNMMAPTLQLGASAAPVLGKMLTGLGGVTLSAGAAKAGMVALGVAAAPAAVALAAIAGVGAAVWQGYEFVKEGGFQSLKNEWQGFRYGDAKFETEDVNATQRAMENALQTGMIDELASMIAYKQEKVELAKGNLGIQFGEDAPEHYDASGVTAMEEQLAHFRSYSTRINEAAITNGDAFITAYNQAVNNNDQAFATYIANFAAQNVIVGSELKKSGDKLAGGFDAFIARLHESTAAVVDTIDVMDLPVAGSVQGKGSTVNLNGGQTFNIKQDFREADPDRIALFFRKDLVRAATSRTRSRVRTPFGA